MIASVGRSVILSPASIAKTQASTLIISWIWVCLWSKESIHLKGYCNSTLEKKVCLISMCVQSVGSLLKNRWRGANFGDVLTTSLSSWNVHSLGKRTVKGLKFQWNASMSGLSWAQVLILSCLAEKPVSCKYNLQGVVLHRGRSDGGHYWANIKDGSNWFSADDECVSTQPISSIVETYE